MEIFPPPGPTLLRNWPSKPTAIRLPQPAGAPAFGTRRLITQTPGYAARPEKETADVQSPLRQLVPTKMNDVVAGAATGLVGAWPSGGAPGMTPKPVR